MPEHKEKFSIGSRDYIDFVVGVVFTIFFFSLTGGQYRPSPIEGVELPPDSAPLSILDAEEKFNCEIFHPTIRELQEHINRHGGLRGKFIKVDGWDGTETKAGAKWLRCNQEASKMFARMAKGDKK